MRVKLAQRVYKKLLEVPDGHVTTYGDLARAVGLDNGQRAIGMMMRNNPYPGIVPCHRVVMSDGRIGGYLYGAAAKINMLEREGIGIKDGKIQDLASRIHKF